MEMFTVCAAAFHISFGQQKISHLRFKILLGLYFGELGLEFGNSRARARVRDRSMSGELVGVL